jgi:beta-lactamase superfamily II metal-dependent hydrolase
VTMSDDGLFAGLPAPERGKLAIYVFGPGIGESQVVALPDGRWIVVDTCKHDDVVLPLALLRHFGVSTLDLLVVTHPDRDHYRGLQELISSVDVQRLWRYPGFHQRRPVLARLCELYPESVVFAELRAAENAMASLRKAKRSCDAAIATMPWPPEQLGAPYEVTCIAPCQEDQAYENEQLAKLLSITKDGVALDDRVKRFILGKARGIDGKGNPLSLAIVVRWQGTAILLGGDVEAPDDEPSRGWNGVLAELAQDWPKSLDLLKGLRVVKVSHHGSWGAFCEEAWRLHAETEPVDVAMVTPFRGTGNNPPPHVKTFQALGRFAQQVILTSPPDAPTCWDRLTDPPADHGSWTRITGAGWVRADVPSGLGSAACVAVTIDSASAVSVALLRQGALFRLPTARGVGI